MATTKGITNHIKKTHFLSTVCDRQALLNTQLLLLVRVLTDIRGQLTYPRSNFDFSDYNTHAAAFEKESERLLKLLTKDDERNRK